MVDKPNILVLMTDQQRATASHLYGNTCCETPSLARLADEGVLFENTISPHPLCVPCRVSFWTSQFPHSHGARRNQTLMPQGATHAFQLWKDAGYRTGLIGKNHCFDQEQDLALFDVYNDISHSSNHPDWIRGMEWWRPQEGRNRVREAFRAMQSQRIRASPTALPTCRWRISPLDSSRGRPCAF